MLGDEVRLVLDGYPDIRCVYCANTTFREETNTTDASIVREAIACQSCHKGNDVIDGVPFFGGYDADDFMGLIEIVASQEMVSAPIDPAYVRYLNGLLGDYDAAQDRPAFLRDHPDDTVRAPWFAEHRYHEWTQTRAMLAGHDLAGKRVLNVGAGYGFDSVPLVDAGAEVTCIDYSPMIVARGRKGLPQARWIGGFSHLLPFQDESFDIVCANAAMHHMRSTPVALREMIRVLRPGGFLFTVGDPVRPDGTTDEHALAVFNRHEGVLSGINEGIIRTGDFIDTLAALMPAIEVSLIASVADLSRIEGASLVGPSGFADCWVPWSAGNLAALREQHGGLCVAVAKRASTAIPPTRQEPGTLAAGTVASWLADPAIAYPQLMAWAPDRLVNLPFPGQQQDWFNLLNGWLAPEDAVDGRQAFGRARWLLRAPGATRMRFDACASSAATLKTTVDGILIGTNEISSDWTSILLDFPQPRSDGPLLVEFQLTGIASSDFDDRCFRIRDRAIFADADAVSLNTEKPADVAPSVVKDDALSEDDTLQIRLIRMLSALRPARVEGQSKKRYGRDNDGGYVLLTSIERSNIIYSLGICDDVSFDKEMANLGIDVFQYDHTIENLPEEHARFHFNRIGIARSDDWAPNLKRLDTLININNHESRSDLSLKMDIEGNEWDAFDSIYPVMLNCFDQIVCEFHGMSNLKDEDFLSRAERAIAKLTSTHQVFHVHGNNNDTYSVIAGLVIPNVFELSLARRSSYHFQPTSETFPTPLDQPSTPARPELILGSFCYGYVPSRPLLEANNPIDNGAASVVIKSQIGFDPSSPKATVQVCA